MVRIRGSPGQPTSDRGCLMRWRLARKLTSWGTIRSWAPSWRWWLASSSRVTDASGKVLRHSSRNRRRERRVAHRPHDPRRLGAEVLLKSALKPREQFGDWSRSAGRSQDLARKDELACAAGPRRVRRQVRAAHAGGQSVRRCARRRRGTGSLGRTCRTPARVPRQGPACGTAAAAPEGLAATRRRCRG